MTFIAGVDRSQALVLPESFEDYVAKDHPVRFLDAFVDGLRLERCGFARTRPAETGRPPFAPGDLLKLYLWGYLNKVRSSRRLERECARNLEVIWLMRKLRPDFKTIADFRKDNACAFKSVFRAFNLLCRELDLFGAELVAIDGTRLKAVNHIKGNFSKEQLRAWLERIDARLSEFLSVLDESDAGEQASGECDKSGMEQKIEALHARQKELQATLEELEKSGQNEVSLTDADSRRMHKEGVGYNAQIAVDAKHKLILAQEVINNSSDHNQLAAMAAQAKETLAVETFKAVADRGYYDHEEIAACEKLGVETYIARPQKGSAVTAGRFGKAQFGYDADKDTYRCPGGQVLSREVEWLKRGQPHLAYSNAQACRQCPLKTQCTTATYRRITRCADEAAVEQMQARLAAEPQMLARRKALVEHPFGSIKFWMEQRAFLLRGLNKVRAEFSLTALAYNMKRVLNLVGVERLREKLKAAFERLRTLLGVSRLPPLILPSFRSPSWQIAA